MRPGHDWMSRPQEDRGSPIGHWVYCLSIFIELSIKKKHAWGHASGNIKYLAGSPSTLKQAIYRLITALSFVLVVTGQF
jgi:hypothetical protein